MDKYLKSYLDNNIIREYAKKDEDGYHLLVHKLAEHEQTNLINLLFCHDDAIKDLIIERAQELINERLLLVESQDNYDAGLFPYHDSQTGEVVWSKISGGF